MKSLFKLCLPLLATALLVGCGGGGGDGHSAFTPPNSGKISLDAETRDLPLNSLGALPDPGGPFTSEVIVTVRHRDGSLATEVETVNVSINPVAVATFSTLDDPETEDINEILERWGQAPVDVVAGKATIFVTSFKSPGTATLSVTVPPTDGVNFQSASMDFVVGNVAAPTPSRVDLSSQHPGVYLDSSGGRSTTLITAIVTDAGGQTVPDSSAANVQFEVVGDASNGSLSGDSGSGQKIQVKSTKGVAHASFRAGTVQGPVMIKVTADGADNNVANGISDPVSGNISVIVSDGMLYSLEITSPVFASKLPGITVNSLPVSEDAEQVGGNDDMIPPNPDASLSLTVSALATDRQGNPVLPGTSIRFGSVDEPVHDFDTHGTWTDCRDSSKSNPLANSFKISGCDGNPKEGGTLFTAPTGQFTLVPGAGPQDAAGPGDALVVFGKAVAGNANLESALTVRQINNHNSLDTTSSFNLNATTGSSVDYGPVLPYLIGRSMHGNISATGVTNEVGVASAKLTYTVNSVGHAVAIWAQGAGADRVTDALTLTYPGVAPASLTAFPSPIPGNTTTQVTACLTDALGIPLQGFQIGYNFQLAGGTGSIDSATLPSNGMAGRLANLTDATGCATGQVKTSGVPATAGDGDSGTIVFSAAGATAEVIIKTQVAFLQASPSPVCSSDGDSSATPPVPPAPATVTVRAISTGGTPASGVNISATCDGGATVTPGSGVTNSAGQVSFQIVVPDGVSSQCTYTADNGLTTTSTVRGSGGGFSPPCP